MKIDRIRVDAFGRLEGLDTGPTPLGPLVVVSGPNEAGKSTLFSFLTTALYGFHPASRERNPHVPWGADEAGGSVGLSVGMEACVVVERRLRSTPSGRLIRGDVAEDIRNQPLPWVDHVPRTVFRQVFAVTLADLAGLDEETWARIQDRVLGSMGATDLRSARDVADALEKEAGEIWRPNRRGNQRLRDIQEEIRSLRARRKEALERDRGIRALVEEREAVESRLREVRAGRQRDKLVVEQMQELLPVKRQLDLIDELRTRGGSRGELAGLPEDPQAELERLEADAARLDESLAKLDRAMATPAAVIERFGEEPRSLLAQRDRIAHYVSTQRAAEPDRARLEETSRELQELHVRMRTAADQLFERELDEDLRSAVAGLSIDLLRDRIVRLEHAAGLQSTVAPPPAGTEKGEPGTSTRERRAGTGERRAGIGARRAGMGARRAGTGERHIGSYTSAVIVFTVLGGIGLVWGWGGGPSIVSIVGAALVAAGATLWLVVRSGAVSDESATPQADHAGHLRREIGDMVRGLPLRAEYMNPPGAPLVSALSGLQEVVREHGRTSREADRLRARLSSTNGHAAELASLLGRSDGPGPAALADELERDLRAAEAAADAADRARDERNRLAREREVIAGRAAEASHALERLRTRLVSLDGRPTAGSTSSAAPGSVLDAIRARIGAHARADRIEDELERAHPNLEELRARIRASDGSGASWTVDEEDLAERKIRIEDSERRIEELVARSKSLEENAVHLRERETVDAIDSEIATLHETERSLVRERDRKWILAQLVRDADRRFREEHQPDLVRRASSYLERLTGGRYDRLIVDERGNGDLFQLMGPRLPAPVPLGRPISTATLEQAYLSLRLAIVDHLDQGKERLPLFIDEAFVNWDAERRDHGLDVLAEVSATRQIFAFTCHPEMAERLAALGARVLRLRR